MNADHKIPHENLDPISGEPGAHPVGTGVGAAVGGAAAGAAVGTFAGPVGTVVGAAVGAVAGGMFGKGVAEGVDPTIEEAYWRENHVSRPYVAEGSTYDRYHPAYRHGWESRGRLGGKPWRDMEGQIQSEWEAQPYARDLSWGDAHGAVRDAYERSESEPLEPGAPVHRI